MYKRALSAIFAFIAFAVAAGSVHATTVRGNVYDTANGGGASGASVSVTCNGIIKGASTDSNGLYVVNYTNEECGQFKPVTSTATFNSQSQSQTVFVSDGFRATLDFYFGAAGVPEFGLIPGIVAAGSSLAGFVALRRRHS